MYVSADFYTNVYMDLNQSGSRDISYCQDSGCALGSSVVGAFVDKHNPKLSKYRSSYLGRNSADWFCYSLFFWNGFFQVPLFYAYFTYVGLSMCYALINVPYGALNASLTRDTNEITVLTRRCIIFLANLGGLAVAYGIPILVECCLPMVKSILPSANAWFITMTIYAVIGLALLMFCLARRRSVWLWIRRDI